MHTGGFHTRPLRLPPAWAEASASPTSSCGRASLQPGAGAYNLSPAIGRQLLVHQAHAAACGVLLCFT